MNVRPARPTDVHMVVPLLYLASHDIAAILTGAKIEEAILATLSTYFVAKNNRFSYQQVRVVEVEQQVVAMILAYDGAMATSLDQPLQERLRLLYNNPLFTIDPETKPGEYYIDTLATSPLYQGRGLGSLLLKDAEVQARKHNLSLLALNVDYHNKRAFQLYERLGYHVASSMKIYNHRYWHMIRSL